MRLLNVQLKFLLRKRWSSFLQRRLLAKVRWMLSRVFAACVGADHDSRRPSVPSGMLLLQGLRVGYRRWWLICVDRTFTALLRQLLQKTDSSKSGAASQSRADVHNRHSHQETAAFDPTRGNSMAKREQKFNSTFDRRWVIGRRIGGDSL